MSESDLSSEDSNPQKKKKGRPKGSKNKRKGNDIPLTRELLKLSKDNYELALGRVNRVLKNKPNLGEEFTPKDVELATKQALDLGKHYLDMEITGDLDEDLNSKASGAKIESKDDKEIPEGVRNPFQIATFQSEVVQ